MRIRPFKALRPKPDLAAQVGSLPYDVGELADARAEAQANPKSFLHVERPEVDLPDAFAAGQDHESAAKHLQQFRAENWLVQEAKPCLYVYRLTLDKHIQTGIIACCNIDDYWTDVIKKHEKTKKPVEDQRTQHVLATNANTGPIFLLYRDQNQVDAQVQKITQAAPLFDFVAKDTIRHTVWTIEETHPLVELFARVPFAYVADGHHRAAAAGRAGLERRKANVNHRGDEEYNWFLTVLFPASHLKILAYNRYLKDLNGLDPDTFMRRVRSTFTVAGNAQPVPAAQGQVSMYFDGKWHGLTWRRDPSADPVAALDVSVLQARLLGPVLGIDDPRTNARIGYLGGFGAAEELKRRVDAGEAAVAFSMYPTTVNQLMAISDAGQIMPPKSTWFEPKLRSGLFVHLLD